MALVRRCQRRKPTTPDVVDRSRRRTAEESQREDGTRPAPLVPKGNRTDEAECYAGHRDHGEQRKERYYSDRMHWPIQPLFPRFGSTRA